MKKITALIPTTGQRNIDFLIKSLEREVDNIEIYNNPIPIGVANARNRLLDIVVEKYNKEDVFLMIDDDATILPYGSIRNTVIAFDEDNTIGIINIPPNPIHNGVVKETIVCYHPFLIRGELIFSGIRYVENSFPDETQFGLDVWLSGYRNIITNKCSILQHSGTYNDDLPCNTSIADMLYREGKLGLVSAYTKYKDLFTWTEREYIKTNIPIPSSTRPTDTAKEIHNTNREKIIQKYKQ